MVIFRSRLRPEHAEEFQALADRMRLLAESMPGFISYKAFTAPDGERCSIHEWESAEHLLAWRNHPEHARIQRLGRERFYESYHSQVVEHVRESRFDPVESASGTLER